MQTITTLQALNAFVLITFTFLVVAGALRTLYRYFEYKRAGHPVPVLLIRDIISRNGLALSFLMILIARSAELTTLVAGQIWWVVITAAPGLFGAAVYAYFEFFVIDKVKSEPYERRRLED